MKEDNIIFNNFNDFDKLIKNIMKVLKKIKKELKEEFTMESEEVKSVLKAFVYLLEKLKRKL